MFKKIFEFQDLPNSFYILWIGVFINALGGFVTPFMAMYLTSSRGFSLEFTGIVSGLIGAGIFLAGPLGGHASDIFGRCKTLAFSLIISALSLLLLCWIQQKILLLFIGFINGLVSGMYRPIAYAAVSDLVEKSSLHRAYRLIYWAINIGFAIASSLAGYFVTKNFKLLFIVDALTTFIFALIVLFCMPETYPKEIKKQKIQFILPFKDPIFIKLFFLHLLVYLILLQVTVTFPIDLISHGISPQIFGYLTALNGIIIVIFQPLLGKYIERSLSPAYWLSISSLLYGIGFGLNAIAGNVFIYILGVITWSFGELVAIGFATMIISNLAPSTQKGGYLGTFQMSWGASVFLAPILGSSFMAHFGSTTLWFVCFVTGAFVSLSYISIAKQLKNVSNNSNLKIS